MRLARLGVVVVLDGFVALVVDTFVGVSGLMGGSGTGAS